MRTLFTLLIALSFISFPVFADDLIISETQTSFLGNIIDPTMLDTETGALSEPTMQQQMPIAPISESVLEQAQNSVAQPVIIQKEQAEVLLSGTTTYSGKLVKEARKKGDMLHKYAVLLSDGEKLSLATQRSYDELVGKAVSMTIEGTKKNFKILSLEGAGLVKSGPEYFLLLAAVVAVLGGFLRRKLSV